MFGAKKEERLSLKSLEYVCRTFSRNLRMYKGDYEKAYNLTVANIVSDIQKSDSDVVHKAGQSTDILP